MLYTVKASTLNLRKTPDTGQPPAQQVPLGTILHSDRLEVGHGAQVIGFDDPSTPEPAKRSRHWIHVTAYTLPDHRTVEGLDLYASLAWVEQIQGSPPGLPIKLTFVAPPRISLAGFNQILARAKSPAAGQAQACYATCCEYGMDPAIALAFFKHESTYGTKGIATRTRNWGNLRRSQGNALKVAEGWAWYATWEDSIRDWCILIGNRYIKQGLITVDQAIPVYAPSADHNNPDRYIASIYSALASWGGL